ncbi:hypothetical protein H257_04750 [Aphanomyces astaci]|uniref:DUF6818 domain-containing protein n=1 Tax=Aphanomyces astaci TaxID=112090 RepID=W4GTG1_APHAT|nr:hypothetical protein H257_04750 [Aphanomyces astaci]ETV83002.1 hypothetical protein H257_04750 [Aphanomyces astaci]|eukprot:XP_009827673.1 hypothetical protein H257_04750 [Aphanomyces astaci]
MTTITDEDNDDITAYIRQERQRSLTKEERLDILRLHVELRCDNVRNASTKFTIARLLGRSRKIVKEVWSDYLRTNTINVATPPSNQHARPTRIPSTHAVTSLVRQFVRPRSMTRVRTVAKDVMAVLLDTGVIQCDVDRRVASCLRVVQLHLDRMGFKRGKCRGKASYSVSAAHAAARDIYIKRMTNLSPDTPAMDSVEALGKGGVTFVMDNAKYHKGLPADIPRGTWRKAGLLLACQRYGVDVECHDLKKTIWGRLKHVLSARADPVVMSMARSRERDGISLRRRFQGLNNKTKPTGTSYCPPKIERAKRLYWAIESKVDVMELHAASERSDVGSDGNSPQEVSEAVEELVVSSRIGTDAAALLTVVKQAHAVHGCSASLFLSSPLRLKAHRYRVLSCPFFSKWSLMLVLVNLSGEKNRRNSGKRGSASRLISVVVRTNNAVKTYWIVKIGSEKLANVSTSMKL